MDAKRVCDECTQNCVLVHGQKLDPSSVDNSFVKLLFGEYDFSKFLYLPPKVSQITIPVLKDGDYHLLEDYTGKRWLVKLGISQGALAFEKGWDQFYADHDLKEGYILQFNFMGSHFVVKIYDTTGTQKLCFKENRDKRKRSATDGSAEMEGQKILDASTKNPGSTSIAPGSEDNRMQSQPMVMNEPTSSENGDARSKRPSTTSLRSRAEKERESQVTTKDKDVGSRDGNGGFKLPPTTSLKISTKNGRKSQVMTNDKPVSTSVISEVGEGTQSQLKLDENPVSRKVPSGEPPAEVADNTPKRSRVSVVDNDDQDDLSGIPFKKRAVSCKENTTKSSIKSKIVGSQEAAGSSKRASEFMKVPEKEPTESGKVPSYEQINSGKHLKSNEWDQTSSGREKVNEVPKEVNTQPVESPDQELLDASRESCKALVESEEALELPVSLPLISLRKGTDRKVVRLKGVVRPDELLWPVLYVETRGLKALIGGWKNFCNSNALQKGDECTFVLENKEGDPIYKVNVIRKVDK